MAFTGNQTLQDEEIWVGDLLDRSFMTTHKSKVVIFETTISDFFDPYFVIMRTQGQAHNFIVR